MKYTDKRTTQARWRAFGSMALAAAAVAVVGFTSVAPAKADDDDWAYRRSWRAREWREHNWRERREEWRERHPYAGFYYSAPQPYGYYEYHYYR